MRLFRTILVAAAAAAVVALASEDDSNHDYGAPFISPCEKFVRMGVSRDYPLSSVPQRKEYVKLNGEKLRSKRHFKHFVDRLAGVTLKGSETLGIQGSIGNESIVALSVQERLTVGSRSSLRMPSQDLVSHNSDELARENKREDRTFFQNNRTLVDTADKENLGWRPWSSDGFIVLTLTLSLFSQFFRTINGQNTILGLSARHVQHQPCTKLEPKVNMKSSLSLARNATTLRGSLLILLAIATVTLSMSVQFLPKGSETYSCDNIPRNVKQVFEAPLSSWKTSKSFKIVRHNQYLDSEHCEDMELARCNNVKSTNVVPLPLMATIPLALFTFAFPFVAEEFKKTGRSALRCSFDQSKTTVSATRQAEAPFSGKKRLLVSMSPLRSSILLFTLLSAVLLLTKPMEATQDLRESIINGSERCFRYIPVKNLFHMDCSVLHWQAQGYGNDTYISLGANEIFDGDSTADPTESYIDLSGMTSFLGLFKIKIDEVTTFAEAPLIRNVHVRNGEVAEKAGFIVQKEQKNFMIDSCSSTGDVTNNQAGGICGYKSALNGGALKILNSYSIGKVTGESAAGIAGEAAGHNGGIVNITRCYSTGNIEGSHSGGICGKYAGQVNGEMYIKESYSTGDISGYRSGGIVGLLAGANGGYVHIQECYSTGHISATHGGGITGSHAAKEEGEVHIVDCYTRGNINGQYAGGITGYRTGGCCPLNSIYYGDLYIKNSYAAGIVNHVDAGGIIGHIAGGFQGHTIQVQYSVYSNQEEGKVIGDDVGNHLDETGNSNDLADIQGQLYHYGGVQRWNSDEWVSDGVDTLPILRFQLPPSPSPSPTPSMTSTASVTGTPSRTPSHSPTPTSSTSGTPTTTSTPTTSSSVTQTASVTASATPVPLDLRERILMGKERCFRYTSEKRLFEMICTVLEWKAERYGPETHISLGRNETFDGRVDQADTTSYIDLTGVVNFKGIIAVTKDVNSFAEAPLIRNIHVRNGTTAQSGGFVVRSEQNYFVVDSCSSTGDITNDGAGGICGEKCGGEIRITDSYSTGQILGTQTGGITGEDINGVVNIRRCFSTGAISGRESGGICGAYVGNRVNITECYSNGDIEDSGGGIVGALAGGSRGVVYISLCFSTGNIKSGAGGICGSKSGRHYGQVYISQSYSTGDIVGGGGIAGSVAAMRHGYVFIRECYTTGRITNTPWDVGGGVVGSAAATDEGEVHIVNCYTSGAISGVEPSGIMVGLEAGGITASRTGGWDCCESSASVYGDVYINNSYASGSVASRNPGGIIGSIDDDFNGHTVHAQYSVYNGETEKVVGEDPGTNLKETGNSPDLNDIRGQLYHWNGSSVWDSDIWAICPLEEFPVLSFQLPCPSPTPTPTATPSVTPSSTQTSTSSPTQTSTTTPTPSRSPTTTPTPSPSPSITPTPSNSPSNTPTPSRSPSTTPTSTSSSSVTPTVSGTTSATPLPGDLRTKIIEGEEKCFRYTQEENLFEMICDVLDWKEQYYGPDTYISLGPNEVFDGNGGNHSGQSIIDLGETYNFKGLISVTRDVSSFAEAPLIRNVHVRNGLTSWLGGFIVGTANKYFIVDSCSSTGTIRGPGGGICGHNCGRSGEIRITNSYSTGSIQFGGGITGNEIGNDFGIVNISGCYSTGNIGRNGGGICGGSAGKDGGKVYITQSYSTGDIQGGGGIVGSSAGKDSGYISIRECFSTGDIEEFSGGISGGYAGRDEGEVHIVNCYSRGDIGGSQAGGITGRKTGGYAQSDESSPSDYGSVYVNNTYALGAILHDNAGGIIGGIVSYYQGQGINVQYSVYNDDTHQQIVGEDSSGHLSEAGNSHDLTDIRGRLYHWNNVLVWDSNSWAICRAKEFPVLHFQLPCPTPSPTVTPTQSFTPTQTSTRTSTTSPSKTPSSSGSVTPSSSITRTPTYTPTRTLTPSRTPSSSGSRTSTASVTPSRSPSRTATPTSSETSTWTASATPSTSTLPLDLRKRIMNDQEPCFKYIPGEKRFELTCSVLNWQSQGYQPETHISLGPNEIFDGSGDQNNGASIIDLSGITNFEGLITVSSNVSAFADAPLIMNVHVKNGELAEKGGFIVQEKQKYFIVECCSSAGDIIAEGGGICGSRCGLQNGEIKILNSHSTGNIMGKEAGGITGSDLGYNGGIVHITQCYSIGDIGGSSAGGIIGTNAGGKNGTVHVKQSYSTGDIVSGADWSGGIVGWQAGQDKGHVHIQECYSTGKISAKYSGGISGSLAADQEGEVRITDCYTLGDIGEIYAGGITGGWTGGGMGSSSAEYGDVYIINTYTSGKVKHPDAGGIIGHIYSSFKGHIIQVQYSVYSDEQEGKIIGQGSSSNVDETGNSDNLNDIRSQLYHYAGKQQWSNDIWIINETDTLPVLRFQLPLPSPSPSPTPLPLDLRENIVNGKESCFEYNTVEKLFRMTCSVLNWKSEGYGPETHISLGPGEIFDGGGDQNKNNGGSIIDLSGITNFEGLVSIRSDVNSIGEAPVIRHVHVKNGTLADKGGYIVREQQRYFTVDLCSSTGDITNREAGGICGYRCGRSGDVQILNSHSTGQILADFGGGIAGRDTGMSNGIVRIIYCHSTGNIEGSSAGGICGRDSGSFGGKLYITHCYSTGKIRDGAKESGGIVGRAAGLRNGYVQIRECFSTGTISAVDSGGISGAHAASYDGEMYIHDCYSHGDISARYAGGIIGGDAGGGLISTSFGFGSIYVNSTYASGAILHSSAGGIVGSTHSDFDGVMKVSYSVYNGKRIVGSGPEEHVTDFALGNSNDLDDIRGQLYHHNGVLVWDSSAWAFCDQLGNLPILSFQLPCPNPSPSPSPTPSATHTVPMFSSPAPTSGGSDDDLTDDQSAENTPTSSGGFADSFTFILVAGVVSLFGVIALVLGTWHFKKKRAIARRIGNRRPLRPEPDVEMHSSVNPLTAAKKSNP